MRPPGEGTYQPEMPQLVSGRAGSGAGLPVCKPESPFILRSLGPCCPVAPPSHSRSTTLADGRNAAMGGDSWPFVFGATLGSSDLRSTSCSDLVVC